MKNYKILYLLMIVFLGVSTSCEDYLDINVDPLAATSAEPDLLFPVALANMSSTRVIEAGPGQMFSVQNWISNGSAGVFLNPERYTISPFTTGNTWSSNYLNNISSMTLAIQDALGRDIPNTNIAAQCMFLKTMSFYQLTTLFEDIPYSQAVNLEFPEPAFDSQEDVLRGLLDDLDMAIDLVDLSEDALPGAIEGDFIYNGDMEKWVKFAKSLKLKTLMLLYNRDQTVANQIDALISEGDLILVNDDEASFPYFEDVTNANNRWKLYNQFGGFSAGVITSASAFLYAGAPLVDIMNDLNDPRLSTYFDEGTDADPGQFVGGLPGVTGQANTISVVSVNLIRRTYPDRFITPSEINLLIADFLVSENRLNDAQPYFVAGIRTSMQFFNGLPGQIAQGDQDAYVSSLPTLNSLSQANALEAVRIQQYIDLNERGAEAWTNWRRTKVPELDLPEQATLPGIIRRWAYPPAEITRNPKTPTSKPLEVPMWFEN